MQTTTSKSSATSVRAAKKGDVTAPDDVPASVVDTARQAGREAAATAKQVCAVIASSAWDMGMEGGGLAALAWLLQAAGALRWPPDAAPSAAHNS